MAIKEQWSSRELERQFKAALFERTILNPPKVSAVVTQIHPAALDVEYKTQLPDKKLLQAKLHLISTNLPLRRLNSPLPEGEG
jgi:predicted nuclease of restriction endonuclease-like (RecB) superfamily